MEQIKMQHWYPTDKLPLTPSINQKFITDLGGDNFSYLWTRRNLYLLSEIFNCILNEDKKVVKHLLAAFVHTLHLVCKMVYPRAERGDRRYSGSWGRADYMIRNKSMEQNPLIIFQRSCFDRCQTAHCGRGKSHFIFGGLASPIVPYRNLTQTTDGITADCRSLV